MKEEEEPSIEQPSIVETEEGGENQTQRVTISEHVQIVDDKYVEEVSDDQREDTPGSSKDLSPFNEGGFSDQPQSDSVSTPPSPRMLNLRAVSPLEEGIRRPRTLSLVNELYGDLQAYDRPASLSSNENDSPLARRPSEFRVHILSSQSKSC